MTPSTTMIAGARLKASVSVKVSKEFMPRVILRTVAPAKLLACQSDEKRCTLAKASRPMAVMARALMRLSRKVTSWREVWKVAASTSSRASAFRAGHGSSRVPCATASTSLPAASGTDTSTSVEATRATRSVPNSPGDSSQ